MHAELDADQVRAAMAGLESQRAMLSDAIVEPALAALRQQLAALDGKTPAAPVAESALLTERRIVTVLFADIVGSTSLAEKLDPEDWRDMVAAVYQTVSALIQAHDGAIVSFLGDGFLALFGANTSSERDPENAVRAGLAIQAQLASRPADPLIQLRIGIHTGMVVLGEVAVTARREYTAMGDAMNLAARLQSAAPPGGILISHDTYRHMRGVFDMTVQPPLMVKGKSEPIQTYLVQRAKPRPFRTTTRGVAGVEVRVIGRADQLRQLHTALEAGLETHALVWAQLLGEPGIGKSRLLDEMQEYLDLRPELFFTLRARAFQGDEKQPFALIRRMWFDRFQIAEDSPLVEAEARWLEQFLAMSGSGGVEGAHALGLLVGLPFLNSPHIGAMRDDPTQVRGRATVVSQQLLADLRTQSPVVLLLEDLQWADASSLDYLMQVIVEGPGSGEPDVPASNGVYILATARPEWVPPAALARLGGTGDQSGSAARYLPISLEPLTSHATRDLAHELLRNVEGVPDDVIHVISDRSEGVPYYAEEIVNWFLDRGIIDQRREPWRFVVGRLQESPLPATLQHLLLTRLSALNDPERIVLQRGSIFGRNFWEGGLEALQVRESNVLLSRLQPRGFVEVQPESSLAGDREWSFQHNLLREVTYDTVLKRERKGLHKTAATWLELQARQAGRLGEFVGIIGEHAERSGETIAAADWYIQAGDHARTRGATSEARKYYDRALGLIPSTDQERRWQALLGQSKTVKILGDTTAYQVSVTMLVEAAQELDDGRKAEAHICRGYYLDSTGDYRSALQAYETTLALARRANARNLEAESLALMSISQNRLGDQAAAASHAQEALSLAHEIDEVSVARTVSNVAVFYVETGDLAQAALLHQEQAAILHRLGDRSGEANALGNLGYDYVCLGMPDMGRAALEQSIQLCAAIGVRRELAYNRLNLALAYWRSGNPHDARDVLERMQTELAALGDTFALAAGSSYLALVLEQAGNLTEAARRFAEARDLYGTLGVRGYGTDALTGLARCALALGNPKAALQHVQVVWNNLQQHGTSGMEFPVWTYLTCATVFASRDLANDGSQDRPVNQPKEPGAGDYLSPELVMKGESRAALDAGYHELIGRAGKISQPEWRKSYLENVPEHRDLMRLWERVAGKSALS